MPERVDFDVWSPMVASLDARHWRPGVESPHGHEFSTPPTHSPDLEQVVSEEVRADVARVDTEYSGPLPRFWEYQLDCMGDDWRIFVVPDGGKCQVVQFFDGSRDYWGGCRVGRVTCPTIEAAKGDNTDTACSPTETLYERKPCTEDR
jgi:hypothetical protein